LEKGKYTLAYSSGCAAITGLMMTMKSGDVVISIEDVYGGTRRLFDKLEENYNIKFIYISFFKLETLLTTLKSSDKVKLVYIETPTNPCLNIADIEETAKICKEAKVTLAIDNTFASPYLQSPLKLGADIVVHSCTKYICGHCDVLMGSITVNSKEIYDKLYFISKTIGAVPSPFDCYLALRGLKTLKIRMETSCKNALTIA